jgi:hypothetical protein
MPTIYANALFGRWKNAVYAAITAENSWPQPTDLLKFFFSILPINATEKAALRDN